MTNPVFNKSRSRGRTYPRIKLVMKLKQYLLCSGATLALGIIVGGWFSACPKKIKFSGTNNSKNKLNRLIDFINNDYKIM
jgi:hypothetical protein